MDFIHIKNTNEQLSPNFNMQEIYSPTLTKPGLEFDLPKCILDSIQHLRTVWATPIEVTSVYRPTDTFGFHKTGDALDFITYDDALGYIEKWRTMCINYKTSSLFQELRALGLKGFGIEGSCIHIDYRPDEECTLEDDNGKCCIFMWEPDGTPYGHSEIIS